MASEKKKIEQAEIRKQRMKQCPYCGSENVENQTYQEKKGQIGAATAGGRGLFFRSGALGGASKQINGYETIVKCNDCGATWNVNPPKKKKWPFILLGFVIFIIIISLLAGSGSDTEQTAKQVVYGVGDTVEADKAEITLVSAEFISVDSYYYDYGTIEQGYKVFETTFNYKNTCDSDIYISESDFDVYADNTACESIWLINENDINENISAGREATMSYTWLVPETATVFEMEYSGTLGLGTSDEITFKIDLQ